VAEVHARGEADVLAMQMEALYKTAPASVLSIVGAVMALAAYWAPDTSAGLIVFFACVSAVALVHLGSAVLRRAGRPAGWRPSQWALLVSAIFFCSGLAWGLGGAWMLGQGNEQQALVACCLAMGAVTVTFPAVVFPRAFNLFQVPVLLPVAAGLVLSDLEYGAILAFGSVMLCIVMALIGHGIGAQLILAMRLSLENGRLAERLEERGLALEVANRELEIQSLTDPLTGTANRRQLMTVLRAAPSQLAVLVVDVDHFKSYNDAFGHAEGDACLILIAEALRRSARPRVDLVARQGGEEFAMVLPDVGEDAAQAIAEQARLNVEALFENRPGMLRRQVTISIGIACRTGDSHRTIDDLVGAADAAVYEAKKAGRNRVSAGRNVERGSAVA